MRASRVALVVAVLALLSLAGHAQTRLSSDGSRKYWIEFRDKGINAAQFKSGNSVFEKVRALLSAECLGRRARELHTDEVHTITLEDAPISKRYVNALEKWGIHVEGVSKWCDAVSAELSSRDIQRLRRASFVRAIRPVGSFRVTANKETTAPRSIQPNPSNSGLSDRSYPTDPPAAPQGSNACGYNPVIYHYGYAYSQLSRINVWPLHAMGLDGSGVRFGYLDVGFRWRAFPALSSRHVIFEHDYVMNDTVTTNKPLDDSGEDIHGTATMSIGMAYEPDSLIGPAFNASVMLAKTEDVRSERNIEEDNYAAALEDMEARGVDITTSSLGYFKFDKGQHSYSYADMNGHTTICTRAAEHAAHLGVLVVTAMGNSGTDTVYNKLSAPADADSILSVGALYVDESVANFSSRGPTFDGRMKPEICAPGVAIWHQDTSGLFTFGNGTSYATPLTSASCCLIKQAHPEATAQQIRRAIMRTGGNAAHPDSALGWGRLNAYAAALELGTIVHVMNVSVDSSVSICAGVASKFPIRYVYLSYAGDSGLAQKTISLNLVGDSLIYSGTVPIAGTDRKFYYRLRAIDASGAQTLSPATGWDTVALPLRVNGVSGPTLAEVPSALNVVAYPNPCTSKFLLTTSEPGEWQLIDALGRTVRAARSTETSSPISTQDLSAGAYYLRFTSRQGETKTVTVAVAH